MAMYNAGFGGGFLRRMTRLAASASTRLESTGSPPLVCPLPSRSALSLRGSEASALLQGLVTNDLRHLDDRLPGAQDLALQQEPVAAPGVKQASDRRAIYALFLNTAGRVLFDALVFSDREDPDRLVLDCHKDVAEKVAKHLKMYKLRRKVDIEVVQGAKAVAVLNNSDGGNKEKLRVRLSQGAVFSVDPRLPALGHRFVLPPASGEDNPFGPGFSQGSESDYDSLRHQLGVSEGPHEMPPGKCFPLEYNADYLHGVSFHKGCYIGQELTARVHHTGVVRKRIVPLTLDGEADCDFDSNFVDEKGRRVGKLRGLRGRTALGLMRLQECSKAEEIRLGEAKVQGEFATPEWWPKEAPKKRLKAEEDA